MGSHPGALSSCCVCASFFCAPHRCYENLRSPAGKVTSARAASPQAPAWALPRVGWAPFNQTSCSHCQFVSSLFSPPSSSQPPPPPHSCWLTGSEFSPLCAPFSLLPERYLGESFNSGEGPGLLALPMMSLFPVNPGSPEFYLPGSEEGVANSHPTFSGPQGDATPLCSHLQGPSGWLSPGGPSSFLWPSRTPAWLGQG